jgi:hypothetical protein
MHPTGFDGAFAGTVARRPGRSPEGPPLDPAPGHGRSGWHRGKQPGRTHCLLYFYHRSVVVRRGHATGRRTRQAQARALGGLRVGLGAGVVNREDADYFGEQVIKAARLCHLRERAGPGRTFGSGLAVGATITNASPWGADSEGTVRSTSAALRPLFAPRPGPRAEEGLMWRMGRPTPSPGPSAATPAQGTQAVLCGSTPRARRRNE